MKKNLIAALFLSLGISVSASAADQFLWMEAESGAEINPMVVKSDLSASQAIYLGSWKWPDYSSRSADDGMISFDIYIPEAGEYKLWALLRLPYPSIKPFDISVGDGSTSDSSQWKSWAADSRSDAKSWGWSNSGFTQSFSKGPHTLHLVQREGGPGVHLDKILLTNVSSYLPSGVGAREPTIEVANPYSSSAVGKYGQLRVTGNQLSDKNGQLVQLQGISAHGLQWFPLIDKQTIPNVAQYFGAEVFRLAMYIEDYSPTDPSDFWGGYMANKTVMMARTEKAIEDAVAAGMYVLVDWHIHNTPGNYTTEAVAFFTQISKKYGHLPNIIYEICNEPVAVSWSGGIKPYANTVINAIRQNDPDNIIIVGTPNWSQDVDIAAKDPLSQSNIMYGFHFYAATHDFNTMKNKVESALAYGAAIFVSEWGSSDVGTSTSNIAVAKQWMDFMNQRKLSWVNWSLGNKDEASSILKPRAPMSGPWFDSDLTEAGKWLKPYFDATSAGSSTGGSTSTSSSSSSSSSSSGTATTSSSSRSSGTATGSTTPTNGTLKYNFESGLEGWTAASYISAGPWAETNWAANGTRSLKADVALSSNQTSRVNIIKTENWSQFAGKILKARVRHATWGNWAGASARVYAKSGSAWTWVDSGYQSVSSDSAGRVLTLDLGRIANLNEVREIGVEIKSGSGATGGSSFYVDFVTIE